MAMVIEIDSVVPVVGGTQGEGDTVSWPWKRHACQCMGHWGGGYTSLVRDDAR
jgi:hypothetical protein